MIMQKKKVYLNDRWSGPTQSHRSANVVLCFTSTCKIRVVLSGENICTLVVVYRKQVALVPAWQ